MLSQGLLLGTMCSHVGWVPGSWARARGNVEGAHSSGFSSPSTYVLCMEAPSGPSLFPCLHRSRLCMNLQTGCSGPSEPRGPECSVTCVRPDTPQPGAPPYFCPYLYPSAYLGMVAEVTVQVHPTKDSWQPVVPTVLRHTDQGIGPLARLHAGCLWWST